MSTSDKPSSLLRSSLLLLFLLSGQAWCQSDTYQQSSSGASEDTQLRVPPPVSGQAYSTSFEGETESNYLRLGLSLTTAYSNDVNGGTPPVPSMSYSIWPTVALDKVTYRLKLLLNYSPGFTFYQNASSLNQGNHNLGLNLQYRLSPNISATLRESFYKTSNIFDQANPLNTTSVSGGAPISGTPIIVPSAGQSSNTTTAQVTYQMSEKGMIGGSGTFSTFGYSSSPQTVGLFNSQSEQGSFFYSTEIHNRYSLGASYQYQDTLSFSSSAPGTQTQTQAIFAFLTVYVKPNLSLSFSAGPQHYNSVQPGLPVASSWQPMTMFSVSWRGERTTISGSYARTVSGGGGLNGTFHSNNASLSLGWRATRNWTANISGSYQNNRTLTPYFVAATPGGHSLSGTVSMQRTVGEHTSLQLGYSLAHQTYSDIAVISSTPNISRAFVTLHFILDRPLQR